MNKSFKVAALLAVTVLFLAAPVFAQSAGMESNTSKATAGVFTGDIDDAMDVHDFSGLKFDKGFGFIGYGGNITNNPASLGYASRFGGLYLGLWYTGNVVRVRENWEEQVTTTYDLINQIPITTATRTQYFGGGNIISSNNQIEALLGIGSMGFKIGFHENVSDTKFPGRIITVTENQDGTVTHSNGDILEYSNITGSLSPSLTWGMSIDLGSFAIKPLLAVGIGIGLGSNVNNYRDVPYITVGGELRGTETINLNGSNSAYINPDFKVGADIDFANLRNR